MKNINYEVKLSFGIFIDNLFIISRSIINRL